MVVRNVDVLARIHYSWEPPFDVAPGQTALLVVCLQRSLADRAHGVGRLARERGQASTLDAYYAATERAIANLVPVLAAARRARIDVIHIRLARRLADGRDVPRGVPPDAWPPVAGSEDAAFVPAAAPVPGELVFDKTTPSAFTSTGLDFALRTMGIRNLLVCGIPTNVDVFMTVRDADDHGYRVITIGDCCAASSQELHDRVLPAMNMRRMRVRSSSEAIALLETAPKG